MIAKGGCWCPPFTPPQMQALQSSVCLPHFAIVSLKISPHQYLTLSLDGMRSELLTASLNKLYIYKKIFFLYLLLPVCFFLSA